MLPPNQVDLLWKRDTALPTFGVDVHLFSEPERTGGDAGRGSLQGLFCEIFERVLRLFIGHGFIDAVVRRARCLGR